MENIATADGENLHQYISCDPIDSIISRGREIGHLGIVTGELSILNGHSPRGSVQPFLFLYFNLDISTGRGSDHWIGFAASAWPQPNVSQ